MLNWPKGALRSFRREQQDATLLYLTFMAEKRPLAGINSKSLLHSRAAMGPEPPAWSPSSTSPAGQTSGCRSPPSAC